MDQFSPDIDHDPFFSSPHGLRIVPYPAAKPVRSRGEVLLPVFLSDASLRARAARKTGPSDPEGCCSGTMATVHSNVYKHSAIKRTQLAFDSHSEILPVSFGRPKKLVHLEGDAARSSLLSFTVHTGANKRATTKYASSWPLTFARKGLKYPSLQQLGNILKA